MESHNKCNFKPKSVVSVIVSKDNDFVKKEVEDIELMDDIVLQVEIKQEEWVDRDQHTQVLSNETDLNEESEGRVECKSEGEFLYSEEEQRVVVPDSSSDDVSVETWCKDNKQRRKLLQHRVPSQFFLNPAVTTSTSSDLHPWPYLESFFKYKETVGNSVELQCMLCSPKITEVTAYWYHTSPPNLKKHVERVHPAKLEQYTCLTSQALKRKSIMTKNEDNLPNKQPKIFSLSPVCELKSKVDRLIIEYIITGLHPFSIVETEAFCNLINGIHPGYNMISRPSVSKRIEDAALEVKTKLITAMSNTQYVATTTDCWTYRRHGYIGVTVHWIDTNTFERHSAALACRRFKGIHTYNILASTLDEIYSEYKIRNKVVRTTTDSGSNFLKAFRLYGEASTQSQDIDEEQSEAEESDYESEITIQDTADILCNEDIDTYEFRLPKYQRCACQLLNLVATVDVSKAMANKAYNKIFHSTFAKCETLWNKVGWSSVAAESGCKLQLIRPNQTRWNSTFLAVKRILRIVQEEGEDAIENVCATFKIKMLSPVDLKFLKEYHTTMKPVAKSLDILQSEKYTQMGWLLPTLYQLLTKLERIKISAYLCLPLVTSLLSALRHRFADMLEDPELIAAAILLPKFKNAWTNQSSIISKGVQYIKMHLEKKSNDSEERFDSSSDEEDFFSSLKRPQPPMLLEIDRYLVCPGDGMEIMKSFPALSEVSIKVNTPLPASAACERLFSCAGFIFSPKRSRLDSHNYENQLLIKLNKKICQ